MQFLRTLFWVILAVLAVIFSFANWTPVTLNLWGSIQVDSRLPFLLLIAFLIGFLPMLLLYRTTRWRLRRRAEAAERTLADIRALSAATAAPNEPAQPVPVIPPPGIL